MDAPRTPWLLIAALYATGLLAGAQFSKISLTLDNLAQSYPGWPVAFAVSGVAVMGVLFGVVAGGITARIGPRRAILWALALSVATGALQALLPRFELFMALRIVEGAGHLILVVAVPTLMARLAAETDRALVMAIWATFFGVGFALTSALVGLALVGPSLALVYGGHAGLALVLLGVLAVMLPKGVRVAPRPLPGLRAHLQIYRNPRLFAPGLGHGIYAMLFLALITFAPSTMGAPWLAAALPLAGIAGSLAAGVLARFFAPGALVSMTYLVMAGLFVATAFAGPVAPYLLVLTLGISGVVAGAGFAAVPWLNDSDADRALSNGALAQLGNVGTFCGTPILAALAPSLHLGFAVGVSVIAAAVTGLAYTAARRARSAQDARNA